MSKAPIIIIGAGIGGMSAAIHLAAAGHSVKILEKNPAVGGKMGLIERDGFRWDTGPSVVTMRHVFEDLFASAGRSLDDYLDLQPVDPLTRYFYSDGTQLDVTPDIGRMAAQITELDERDVEGYLRFLAYAARIHRITGPVFIYDEPPNWRSLLRVSPLDALKIDGLRTMQQSIRGFVRSTHLQQLLGRFATYVGANPYQAPATLNVIAHVELTGGVWYPKGGIYKIAEAYAQLARELGVEICTGTSVEKIEVQNGYVRGVIAGGEYLPAQAVIANVDVAMVYEKLLSADVVQSKRLERLTTVEPSCSGFILLLGVEGENSKLAHHNIFFSSDYRREFKQIFDEGVPPDEPTIYVAITSKTDKSHAPPGHENWFVLVNSPALGTTWDWHKEAPAYRDRVLKRLAEMRMDIRHRIVNEMMMTPHDIAITSGARRGALYGASSNNRWAAFLRPHNRASDVKGLYFAGGTTHPGGGVPMVTLSGCVAAKLLMQDLA